MVMAEVEMQKNMRVLFLKQGLLEGAHYAMAIEDEQHDVDYVDNTPQLLEKVKTWSPQLIVLEWLQSGVELEAAISQLREIMLYSPIIVIVDATNEALAIEALNVGADDMVRSNCSTQEFIARLNCQFRNKTFHDNLHKANCKLQELVEIDDLTGLFNMRSIFNKLEYELARAKRYKRSVSVLMLDLDNFKDVNDNNDHLFGSFVLAEVGAIIRRTMRNVDIAARYGGDEFLIILPEIDLEGAYSFAERLRKNIESHEFKNDDCTKKLTLSIGLSITSPFEEQIDSRQLVRCADRALYQAKDSGRNCVKSFNLHEQNKSFIEDHKSYSIVAAEATAGSSSKETA